MGLDHVVTEGVLQEVFLWVERYVGFAGGSGCLRGFGSHAEAGYRKELLQHNCNVYNGTKLNTEIRWLAQSACPTKPKSRVFDALELCHPDLNSHFPNLILLRCIGKYLVNRPHLPNPLLLLPLLHLLLLQLHLLAPAIISISHTHTRPTHRLDGRQPFAHLLLRALFDEPFVLHDHLGFLGA